jgi:hypothetical protein
METEKLYSPLEFYLHNPREEEINGEYGMYDLYDENYKISHAEAMEHMDAIELAIKRDRDRMDQTRGMAEYLDGTLSAKVTAMFPSIEFHAEELWCVTTVTLSEPLTPEELEDLRHWWSGQLSDGWGEGFEQREIKVGSEELYVVPWRFGDDFIIGTEQEFCGRHGLLPPEPSLPAETVPRETDAYNPTSKESVSTIADAEKPSVLAWIREAARMPKKPHEDKPVRDKSGPEL